MRNRAEHSKTNFISTRAHVLISIDHYLNYLTKDLDRIARRVLLVEMPELKLNCVALSPGAVPWYFKSFSDAINVSTFFQIEPLVTSKW